MGVETGEELRVTVPGELKRSFEAAARAAGEPVELVLADLMRSYVECEPEYDAMVRTKIEAALKDPRPGIPHEEVERQMDALFERLEAEQETKRA